MPQLCGIFLCLFVNSKSQNINSLKIKKIAHFPCVCAIIERFWLEFELLQIFNDKLTILVADLFFYSDIKN